MTFTYQPQAFHYYRLDEQLYEVRIHEPEHAIAEDIIHTLWRQQAFDRSELETTCKHPLIILSPGVPNTDSGPDFYQARVQINGLMWSGTVELHTHSRYWYQHGHHEDKRYNNTILHVTLYADEHTGTLRRQDGSILPELVLSPRLQSPLRKLIYANRTSDSSSFPCQVHWPDVPACLKKSWLHQLAYNRLEFRKAEIEHLFIQSPDYEDVLHQLLFKGLGYQKNSDVMHELAKRIPLRISRELDTISELEALHFGVAGLLPDYKEVSLLHPEAASYVDVLHTQYNRLKKTYKIPVMRPASWLFFRLRPANFPTIRIAQAVSWLGEGGLLHHDPVGALEKAFQAPNPFKALSALVRCHPSQFWHIHYRFRKKTAPRSQELGEQRIKKLIGNCIAPLCLITNEHPAFEANILSVLEHMPPEKDSITRLFESRAYAAENSLVSQGMHELYAMYCKPVNCLQCDVGKYILQQTAKDVP